ncbi:MAG: 30S ribosomal protein S6 [Myxococcota bacterium]|nr:30S ribosomal protein S6 [Myxococcota bacterium]
MREYETTIIIQPEISDEGCAAIFDRLDSVLTESGSIRLMNENLGKRKLAYEINRFQKGNYYVYSFLSDGQVVPQLEREMRLNESVLRFMTIQADEQVADIEARKAEAAELEAEHARKAAERAAREEEEAKARAEEEEKARLEQEKAAAAAAAAEAEAATEGEGDATEAAASEGAGEEAAASDAAAETEEKSE